MGGRLQLRGQCQNYFGCPLIPLLSLRSRSARSRVVLIGRQTAWGMPVPSVITLACGSAIPSAFARPKAIFAMVPVSHNSSRAA